MFWTTGSFTYKQNSNFQIKLKFCGEEEEGIYVITYRACFSETFVYGGLATNRSIHFIILIDISISTLFHPCMALYGRQRLQNLYIL